MPKYDIFNREERALCSHLFRLLHERLDEKSSSPFGQLMDKLGQCKLPFKNGEPSFSSLDFENVAIYSEVAIIRDYYAFDKEKTEEFMDDLTRIIMRQEEITVCQLYSSLPLILRKRRDTHPKQIRHKAETKNITLTDDEKVVYGAMQGMFNAKPDLAITIDNMLLVCEAKLTEPFSEGQLDRTWNIAEVWAKLLYREFGFEKPPLYTVFTLGKPEFYPHISWNDILEITERTYPDHDRTRIAIRNGVNLKTNPSKY